MAKLKPMELISELSGKVLDFSILSEFLEDRCQQFQEPANELVNKVFVFHVSCPQSLINVFDFICLILPRFFHLVRITLDLCAPE